MAVIADLPLRWESTGDKWWYASPIDWAAANGHYDLVHQLLRIDGNQLIKLTSLRRIRRLEAVWDNEDKYHVAAMSRCQVACKLYNECYTDDQHARKTNNSLIANGYGGWLLYTAVSAADISFVKEILSCYPLLVFGEGEYGLTDILYGAARSKNNDVFMVVYDYAVSPQFLSGFGGKKQGGKENFPVDFVEGVKFRAVFSAARGGNLIGLKELLGECSDVLVYRDVNGSTLLHAAAGKGQVEVVKYLVASYDMISSIDNEGNTPLHVAAYKGQLSVLEALLQASPSSYSALNKSGNTFLHMVIAGFQTPGFRRLDQQIELMKHLVRTKCFNIENIINCKNNQGRTALHLAIIGNVHSNLVQLLMSAQFININIRDDHGMTPLDYIKRQPQSESSDVLIRHLISAGGISNCKDDTVRKAFASHLKMQGICTSPGTSFRVPDNEIFISTGMSHMLHTGPGRVRVRHLHTSSEASPCNLSSSGDTKKSSPFHNAAKRLMTMLQWPLMKKKEMDRSKKLREETPIPLRQIFTDPNLLRNKRTLEVRSNISSPIKRKKFASGVAAHGDSPFFNIPVQSSSSPVSKPSISSHRSLDEGICMEDETPNVDNMKGYTSSVNRMLCFGGSQLSIKDPIGRISAKRHVNIVA